jgi:hypothetical protein
VLIIIGALNACVKQIDAGQIGVTSLFGILTVVLTFPKFIIFAAVVDAAPIFIAPPN